LALILDHLANIQRLMIGKGEPCNVEVVVQSNKMALNQAAFANKNSNSMNPRDTMRELLKNDGSELGSSTNRNNPNQVNTEYYYD
jgi:hypothetical protein